MWELSWIRSKSRGVPERVPRRTPVEALAGLRGIRYGGAGPSALQSRALQHHTPL